MIQTTTQDTEPRYEAFTVAFYAKPKKPTTREQKIKQLEQMLCARVEAAKPIDDITEALEILQQNRIQDEELIMRYGKSLSGNFVSIAFSLVQVGLVVTLLSLISTAACGHSQTRFCHDARVIPTALNNYFFREPQSKKPPILPANQ